MSANSHVGAASGDRSGDFDPANPDHLFDTFFLVRSGFLQHKGSPNNGCVRLAGMLAHRFGGRGTRIELEAWNDNPQATAEFIYRLGTKRQPPRIGVFAYSWGCGYGFVRLARALAGLGMRVDSAVLCDPVYYGLARWRALLPRTLFRRITISVPANVGEVYWLRQSVSKPAGHDLRAASPYTRIHPPIVLDRPHTQMDDAPEFHRLCLEVARQILQGAERC